MNSFPIPDFIVVGTQVNGEVVLLASRSLTDVELHEELSHIDEHRPKYEIAITAQLKDYVTVRARSYPEAWQALFDIWSPERQELSGKKMLP